MTINTELTPNELKAALILVKSCLRGMGGKRPADLEFDEYTWVDAKDLMAAGYSAPAATGTFGALEAKGFVSNYGKDRINGKLVEQWVMPTAAWKYLDTIWDEKGGAN